MQDEIIREAQIMKLIQHENILSLHCSFVHQEHLWMVMPYVKGGSVLNIMKYAYPQVRQSPGQILFPRHLEYSASPCRLKAPTSAGSG